MRVLLTKRLVKEYPADPHKTTILWDTRILGLGIKLTPGGHRGWVFQYRCHGAQRRLALGTLDGALTLTRAREVATALRLRVASGEDPSEERRAKAKALTVRELVDSFLKRHAARKSAKTRATYESALRLHVLPRLGSRPVESIVWGDFHRLHTELGEAGSTVAANRMLSVASNLFSFAMRSGFYPSDKPNPAKGHSRFKESRSGGQRLSVEEMGKLGAVLRDRIEDGCSQSAAIMALALSGLRPSEVLNAKRSELEGRVLRLSDSKTGARTCHLGTAAAAILSSQPVIDGSPWIFPGRDPSKTYASLAPMWRRIRETAKISTSMRLYDLRHHFISTALEGGLPFFTVQRLAGHATGGQAVTLRYTHLRDEALLRDADRACSWIQDQLAGETGKAATVTTFPGAATAG